MVFDALTASDCVVTITSINGAVGTDNQAIGNDRVVTITSINETFVGNATYVVTQKGKATTASDCVVTITGINGTSVLNATTGSYYVLTITSIDGGKVGETSGQNFTIKSSTLSNDCVFSIAGIYKSCVLDAVKTSAALDRVITITSIESDGAIVDAGTDAAITTDSVVALSSIEDATISDFDSV